MSFLPYNAGGDGDNVWPFVDRDDKFHYDVSKLDQWQIVFDHAQAKGIYLHFKLQEQENDDGTCGGGGGRGGRGGAGGSGRAVARGRPAVRRPRNPHRRQPRRRPRPLRVARRKAAAPADEERDRPPHVRCPRRSTVATPGASAGCISASWSRGSATSSRSTGTWARRTPRRRCSSARWRSTSTTSTRTTTSSCSTPSRISRRTSTSRTWDRPCSGPVAAELLECRAPADDPLGPRIGGGGRAVGGGERRAGIGQHGRAAGSRLPGIHRQGQSGEPGAVAPRHPQADAVGQPDGRWRRRRVLLRLRPARQRPDARELPQPRQNMGLRADRAGVLPRREDSVLGHGQRGRAGRQPDERQQRLLPREGRRGLSRLPAQRRIGHAGSRAASPASSTSAGSTRAAAAR